MRVSGVLLLVDPDTSYLLGCPVYNEMLCPRSTIRCDSTLGDSTPRDAGHIISPDTLSGADA